MIIYDINECNNRDYEDYSESTIVITEDKNLVIEKVMAKLEDEDFTPDGMEQDYTIEIFSWENGKCKLLFTANTRNKIETINFLSTLK